MDLRHYVPAGRHRRHLAENPATRKRSRGRKVEAQYLQFAMNPQEQPTCPEGTGSAHSISACSARTQRAGFLSGMSTSRQLTPDIMGGVRS